MDRERFNTLLADMDKITDQDIKSLNQLRKQYPYFQNQYVMIAKALKKRNHPKTDAFIKKAAIYSADRALLKAIIMDEHDFAPVVVEAPAPPARVEEIPAPQKTEVVAEAETKTEEVAETPSDEVVEKKEAYQPKAESPKEEKNTVQVKAPADKVPEPEIEKPVAEVREVKQEARSTPEPVVKVSAPKAPEQKKTTPPPVPEKAKATPVAADVSEPAVKKPEDNQQLIDELERDLIEIRKKKKLIAKMLEQQEAKQSQKKPAPVKKKTPAPKTSQSELIEKFIQNEPQMGKQKLVHDETEQQHKDLAARFTQEQEDFYTETMAKLMVTQKKYRKAIQVYEKLGLKFPEKRAYFASQIEKVKSRSNV
ncbi:MAG: hypothetical protein Roseis2KO_10030 [Roseivirga sp.]